MKKLLAGAGVLALVLVISCGKEKEVRPYNGHFVTNVTLHPELVKSLVTDKKFDPSQNCIQLVEYSRTPNKSSRSDFYLLFSPQACPANNETVEQFAFASEVQGMEQKPNLLRMYNRLNELSAYNAVRAEVLSGWLERRVENEKVSGYYVSEICNYTTRPKTTSISGCELRIENGRFAIPRDTSLTAKRDQEESEALEQQRVAKTAAEKGREDVIAHTNALHDAQIKRIGKLQDYVDSEFGALWAKLDITFFELYGALNDFDVRVFNELKVVNTNIGTASFLVLSAIAADTWLTNKHLNMVRSAIQKDLAKAKTDHTAAMEDALKRATDHFKLFKAIEDGWASLKDNSTKSSLDKLKTSNAAYQKLIADLTKAVQELAPKEKAPMPRQSKSGLGLREDTKNFPVPPELEGGLGFEFGNGRGK